MLTEASRYGVEHIAFKTDTVDDLEDYETVLERYGCDVERVKPDEERRSETRSASTPRADT